MSQGNMGPSGRTSNRRTADKLKKRFDWLESFSDDELVEIGYCSPGDALSDDENYFDISQPERGVIHGATGEQVPEGSCYVPQGEVPRRLWDKLVGSYS
jgi:hypothetical protein